MWNGPFQTLWAASCICPYPREFIYIVLYQRLTQWLILEFSVLAAVFAAVPFLGTYVAALPAVLELWLINGQPYSALLLFAAHYLPTFVIDTAFYSEMRGLDSLLSLQLNY